MKKRKNTIIATMCILMLLMAIGYAYFATRLNINATGNITTNWNVYFSNITDGIVVGTASNNKTPSITSTTATMDANLALPGDSITYEITLTNGGTIGAIIEDINAEATGSTAIIYTISGIKIGDKLAGGESTTITVKIEYDENTTSQPALTNKTLTVTIDAVQDIGQTITESDIVIEEKTLAARILKENTPQSDSAIDFSQPSSDTNGQGLYYTNERTEDNKTTYYFRGAVDNNYVKLGKRDGCVYKGEETIHMDPTDMSIQIKPTKDQCETTYVCDAGTSIKNNYGMDYRYVTGLDAGTCSYLGGTTLTEKAIYGENVLDMYWRIVRINEDGSIRLITENVAGESVFNEDHNDNAHVGFMYGTPGSDNYDDTHANTNDSTIKDVLDEWYTNNLSSYSNLLADAGFCNDRSLSDGLGYGKNSTVYGAYNRVVNLNKPQFACPQTNDLFTLKGSSKGNKALDNPIGLLTIDEVVYAGASYDFSNDSYLNNGVGYWTMSPYSGGNISYGWRVISPDHVDYSLDISVVAGGGWARPVINFKSDVEFTLEGTGVAGSSTNPYIIKTN